MDLRSNTAAMSSQSRKAFKAQCMLTCLELIQCQMQLIEKHAAGSLEACMCSTRTALAEFLNNGAASSALKKRAKGLLRDIEGAVKRSIGVRAAPVCADVVRKVPKKLLNPKFEVDFDRRKDYDPDRERAEYKQYKRMAAKEKRGTFSPRSLYSLFCCLSCCAASVWGRDACYAALLPEMVCCCVPHMLECMEVLGALLCVELPN